MNVGIVVDASCDLPSSILERHQVKVIPISISTREGSFLDTRQPDDSNEFYRGAHVNKLSLANSMPNAKSNSTAISDNFNRALTEEWLYQFDNLLVIAPHRKVSATLSGIRHTILEKQSSFEQLRRQANLKAAFKIRVIESQSAYTGYGVVLYEALRLYSEKARSADQLKQPLEQFIPKLETYVLPGFAIYNPKKLGLPPFDLGWLEHQKLKFSKQAPIFSVNEAGLKTYKHTPNTNADINFLEIIYDKLTRTKLNSHLVNLSYAGNLAKLRVMPVFKALHEHVKNKGGRLVYSVMSPASGIQLGQHAISVSFSNQH